MKQMEYNFKVLIMIMSSFIDKFKSATSFERRGVLWTNAYFQSYLLYS